MPISPVGAISIPTTSSVQPSTGVTSTQAVGGSDAASGADSVGNLFTDSLKNASDSQATADNLMQQAATGDLQNLTQVMTAMTEAQLSTQLTVALRNKAVESFNEIMRMQL